MYLYNIFGFLVYSYFNLPGVICGTTEHRKNEPDIIIRSSKQVDMGKICTLEQNLITEMYYPLRIFDLHDYIMMEQKGICRTFISKLGNEIIIDEEFNDLGMLFSILMGASLSICFVYKGLIPLHTAGFYKDGNIIGIMGPPGVGKSTLLWEFIKKGSLFVTDDILPIEIKNSVCIGYPSVSLKPKLSIKSLNYMNIDFSEEDRVRLDSEKYYVSINDDKRLYNKAKLHAIYILSPYRECVHDTNKIEIIPLSKGKKTNAILSNIFAIDVLPLKVRKKIIIEFFNYFDCDYFNVYEIKYSNSFSIISEIVTSVTNILDKEIYGFGNTEV